MNKLIWCCGCNKNVRANLTDGGEVYPHRSDLRKLPFWKCFDCHNFVGCHHKTNNPTKPLGCIPTPEIKKFRKQIHALLDPLWKNGTYSRADIYKILTTEVGYKYHTASLKTVDECNKVLIALAKITEVERADTDYQSRTT